jgi:hypothetical protein
MATPAEDGELEALLDYIHVRRNFDFRGYKRTSLTRRIVKRPRPQLTTREAYLYRALVPRSGDGFPGQAEHCADAVLRGSGAGDQVFGQDVQLGVAGRQTAGQRGVGAVLHRVLDAPPG